MRNMEFNACRLEWWCRLFNIYSLEGVRVQGIPPPPSCGIRRTNRFFNYYMMADGIACSVVCTRPKSAAASSYTPETVPFSDNSVFKAIDPGLTDIWSGSHTFIGVSRG